MKTYWDSSALIEVILNQPSARSRFLSEQNKITRCHTLAESFSQLTGGRLGHNLRQMLRRILCADSPSK